MFISSDQNVLNKFRIQKKRKASFSAKVVELKEKEMHYMSKEKTTNQLAKMNVYFQTNSKK